VIAGTGFAVGDTVSFGDANVTVSATDLSMVPGQIDVTIDVGADAAVGMTDLIVTAADGGKFTLVDGFEILDRTATLGAPSPSPLSETNLDQATVLLTLVGDLFEAALVPAGFAVTGPNGVTGAVTVTDVAFVDDTNATLTFAYDGALNLTSGATIQVEILALSLQGVDPLTAQNTLPVVVTEDGVTASLSLFGPDALLRADSSILLGGITPGPQTNLDGAQLTVMVTNDVFVADPAFDPNLDPADFVLVDAPAGTTVVTAEFISATEVRLTLAHDGSAVATLNAFRVEILPGALQAAGNPTTGELDADVVDSDGDEFTNDQEEFFGTDPFSGCGGPDAWPLDTDGNGVITIADPLRGVTSFGLAVPRFDLFDLNGVINIADVLVAVPSLGDSCAAP